MSSAHLVHPELRALLADVAGFELDAAGLAPLRERGGPIPPLPAFKDDVRLVERRILAKGDAPDVDILIYTPVGDGPFPAILHIHGGGFVTGDTRRADGSHRRRARETGSVVVSVNYRLAPETRWPGPLEDCHAALNWLHEQAAALNVDATRLAIMGDSAGGGLAAGLALLVRDEGRIPVAFLLLHYPMLDDREPAIPNPGTGEFIWTAASNRFAWSCLLGAQSGGADVSPYAAPARATNLTGLPPTFISVGALDLFLDENVAFASRLARAGVPVELHVYPGVYHAFEMAGDTSVSRRAWEDRRAALIAALSLPD